MANSPFKRCNLDRELLIGTEPVPKLPAMLTSLFFGRFASSSVVFSRYPLIPPLLVKHTESRGDALETTLTKMLCAELHFLVTWSPASCFQQ